MIRDSASPAEIEEGERLWASGGKAATRSDLPHPLWLHKNRYEKASC
jgi:hypothetical protein